MKKKIITNILFSLVEKSFLVGGQFIISILLIRLLPREDYGIIGIVVGYFTFINILNISLESIILRDHKQYSYFMEKYIYNFFVFNIVKSVLFIIIAGLLSFYLFSSFREKGFVYSIFSITIIYIADTLVAPSIVYNSARFNQRLVTKISFIRVISNIFISFGLFFVPTLQYVFFKDLFVSFIYVSIWTLLTIKSFDIKKINLKRDIDFIFIKKTLFDYSLWTHLNGVVTNFIYRSDTFFLSMFVGLTTIGNYNIALNSANVANILPMIMGYQNSVALSHTKNEKETFAVSNTFIRVSAYLGILTFIIFYLFGDLYLFLITGKKVNSIIYRYMIYIVAGLIIVKSFASPLNAFVNIKGSVYSLFKNVLLVSSFLSFSIYYLSAKYYGAIGISQANILISLLWLFLIVKEVKKYGYDFSTLLCFADDVRLIKGFIRKWVS